jgi:hypothetical protein
MRLHLSHVRFLKVSIRVDAPRSIAVAVKMMSVIVMMVKNAIVTSIIMQSRITIIRIR